MEYRSLGQTSLRLPVFGLGGLHFGVFCDQKATSRIIHRALELGANLIDTAPMYGNGLSETYIGNSIKGKRNDVLLATKVGLQPTTKKDGTFGVTIGPLNRRVIRTSIENSLRSLGTDYVDLFQVHAFDPNTPLEETLATLDDLVAEGKVRFIGCSNYLHTDLELAIKAAKKNGWEQFVSLQNHYNLIERRLENDILPACRKLGVGIICYRALARGILTGKYQTNQPFPKGSRAINSFRVRKHLTEQIMLLANALDSFAKNRGQSITKMAIAWLLAKPSVAVVLSGVRNESQLKQNVLGAKWKLSDEDLIEIDTIIEKFGFMSQVYSMPETFLET